MGDTWYDGGWGGGSGGAPIDRVVVGLRGAKGERSIREAAMVGSPTGADFGLSRGEATGQPVQGTRGKQQKLQKGTYLVLVILAVGVRLKSRVVNFLILYVHCLIIM